MEANENTGCVCEHTLVTNTQTVGDSTVYTYTCDMCGEDNIAPARTISNTVAYYWNPAQVRMWDNNKKPAAGDVFHNPIAKDGEAYVNLKPQEGGAQAASYVVNGVTTSLGKYLAIKYRYKAIDGISDATLYVNVQIAGQSNQKAIANAITDGWVVAVVDISGFNGYAGNESSASLTIFMTQHMELDVAYVVMSDDMADIRALLGENETYFYRGNSFVNEGIEYGKDGCIDAHSLSISTEADGDSTVYTYTCDMCGEDEIVDTLTVPNTIDYYWPPQFMYVRGWDNNLPVDGWEGSTVYYHPIAKDGVAYVRCRPQGPNIMGVYPINTSTPLGKYLAIKYRVTPLKDENAGNMNFIVYIDNQKHDQKLETPATNGWKIAVIDISGFNGYAADREVSFKIDLVFSKATLDLSYIAMLDDLDDIDSLLSEGETFSFRGTSFANAAIAKRLQLIAENEQKVYDAGKKSEYDMFWESFVGDGSKTINATALFAGRGWKATNFKLPDITIKPSNANYIFMETGDLPYEEVKKVDFSQATGMYNAFNYSGIKHLGEIDARKSTNCGNLFSNSSVEIIDKLYIGDKLVPSNWFSNCKNLKEIRFTGTIGQNGLDVEKSTLLSHNSLMSIIDALADKTQDTSKAWTVTLGTDNLAKLTDDEKKKATKKGWSLV